MPEGGTRTHKSHVAPSLVRARTETTTRALIVLVPLPFGYIRRSYN